MSRTRLTGATALIGILIALSGCASHVATLANVRDALVSGQADSAFAAFDRGKAKPDDLLYLLDRGFMLHAAGRWEESNNAFESAERLAETLVTKSVSREAAALLSTDRVRPYSGLPFELKMIPYYRALNYVELGDLPNAVVEARKSSYRLARNSYADSATAGSHQEAFLHLVNGLIFQAGREPDNAAVSFRLSERLYQDVSPDPALPAPSIDEGLDGNIVVMIESGFVPFREQVDLTFPVFKQDDWGDPAWYVSQYGSDPYSWRPGYYPSDVELDHVLRVAFPRLVEPRTDVARCEVTLPDGRVVQAQPMLNLDAVCRDDFNGRLPGILLKTVARAIAKELVRKGAEKQGEGLGILVNLLGAAFESADTRSWTFLPSRIDMACFEAPPGTTSFHVRFLDAAERLVDEQSVSLVTRSDTMELLHFRTYR